MARKARHAKAKEEQLRQVLSRDQLQLVIGKIGKAQLEKSGLSENQLLEMFRNVPFYKDTEPEEVICGVLQLADLHRLFSNYDRQIPNLSKKKKIKFWKSFQSALILAHDKLDALLNQVEVNIGQDGVSQPSKKDNRLFSEFSKIADPRDPLAYYSKQSDGAKIPHPPAHRSLRSQFEQLQHDLLWAAQIGENLLRKSESEKTRRGPRVDTHNDSLITGLAYLYEKATRKQAKQSNYNANLSIPYGPFLDFCSPCITALEPNLEKDQIDALIDRIFKERQPSIYVSKSENVEESEVVGFESLLGGYMEFASDEFIEAMTNSPFRKPRKR